MDAALISMPVIARFTSTAAARQFLDMSGSQSLPLYTVIPDGLALPANTLAAVSGMGEVSITACASLLSAPIANETLRDLNDTLRVAASDAAVDRGEWSMLLAALILLFLAMLCCGALVVSSRARMSLPGEGIVRSKVRGEGVVYVASLLIGALLMQLSLLSSMATPSGGSCGLSAWFWHLGSGAVLAALLSKLLYICRHEHDHALLIMHKLSYTCHTVHMPCPL